MPKTAVPVKIGSVLMAILILLLVVFYWPIRILAGIAGQLRRKLL